jgi:hypothetical protein
MERVPVPRAPGPIVRIGRSHLPRAARSALDVAVPVQHRRGEVGAQGDRNKLAGPRPAIPGGRIAGRIPARPARIAPGPLHPDRSARLEAVLQSARP